MDTSETYIKMCEMAEEIQGHDYIKGDYMVGDFELAIKLTESPCVVLVTNPMTHTEATIWLPRQDQLQEMAGNFTKQLQLALYWIYSDEMETVTSFEQWWLRAIMKEKYNKVWNGTDWIKEGK